ncbi:MAG: hypothetical protein COV52_08005 [Gammaproteobacteria bacterium CG11_big_fil_rev_8_21_14_0_20_46_22]|nr:MAG: hypothetical protein COW05_04085 [Gammaproteobacteria bacterium CG12_big_fil_rev_8_21_14_0_65_46_12]PIR10698.1 MAG: hypothetical protein COV52_08005 [Gammaproteobacteria bacterium CG11_big_fil_rev_8_21_14_0_20_46_22]
MKQEKLKAIYVDISNFAEQREIEQLCQKLGQKGIVFTFKHQKKFFALLKALEDKYPHCKLFVVSTECRHSKQNELLEKIINSNLETELGPQYKQLQLKIACIMQPAARGETVMHRFANAAQAHAKHINELEAVMYIPPKGQHNANATEHIHHQCTSLTGCLEALGFSESAIITALKQTLPKAPPRDRSMYRLTGEIRAAAKAEAQVRQQPADLLSSPPPDSSEHSPRGEIADLGALRRVDSIDAFPVNQVSQPSPASSSSDMRSPSHPVVSSSFELRRYSERNNSFDADAIREALEALQSATQLTKKEAPPPGQSSTSLWLRLQPPAETAPNAQSEETDLDRMRSNVTQNWRDGAAVVEAIEHRGDSATSSSVVQQAQLSFSANLAAWRARESAARAQQPPVRNSGDERQDEQETSQRP